MIRKAEVLEGIVEHFDLELFADRCYYDMVCVKPKSCKDFNKTKHFGTSYDAYDWILKLNVSLSWEENLSRS